MKRNCSSLVIVTDAAADRPGHETSFMAEEIKSLTERFEKVAIFETRCAGSRIRRLSGSRLLTYLLRRKIAGFMRSNGFNAKDTMLYTPATGWPTVAASQLAAKGMCGRAVSMVTVRDMRRRDAGKIISLCGNVDTMLADSEYTRRQIARLTGKDDRIIVCRPIPVKIDCNITATCHRQEERRLTFVSAEPDNTNLTFSLLRQLALARPTLEVKWICFGREFAETTPASPTNLTIEYRKGEPTEIYGSEPADWFISTDNNNGLSAYVAEALGFGVPVVATTGGGIDEIIDDDNGLLLPEDAEPAEFVRGLLPYLDSEPRFTRLRQGALASYKEMKKAVRPGQVL